MFTFFIFIYWYHNCILCHILFVYLSTLLSWFFLIFMVLFTIFFLLFAHLLLIFLSHHFNLSFFFSSFFLLISFLPSLIFFIHHLLPSHFHLYTVTHILYHPLRTCNSILLSFTLLHVIISFFLLLSPSLLSLLH